MRFTLRLLDDKTNTPQNLNGLKWFEWVDHKDEKEKEKASKSLQGHSIGHGVITSYRSTEIKLYIRKRDI
jgi:hypothetical protein